MGSVILNVPGNCCVQSMNLSTFLPVLQLSFRVWGTAIAYSLLDGDSGLSFTNNALYSSVRLSLLAAYACIRGSDLGFRCREG